MDLTFAVSVNVILNLSNKVKILDRERVPLTTSSLVLILTSFPEATKKKKLRKQLELN